MSRLPIVCVVVTLFFIVIMSSCHKEKNDDQNLHKHYAERAINFLVQVNRLPEEVEVHSLELFVDFGENIYFYYMTFSAQSWDFTNSRPGERFSNSLLFKVDVDSGRVHVIISQDFEANRSIIEKFEAVKSFGATHVFSQEEIDSIIKELVNQLAKSVRVTVFKVC